MSEQKNWETVTGESQVRSFRTLQGELVKPLDASRVFVYRYSGVYELDRASGKILYRIFPAQNVMQVNYKFEKKAESLARAAQE